MPWVAGVGVVVAAGGVVAAAAAPVCVFLLVKN